MIYLYVLTSAKHFPSDDTIDFFVVFLLFVGVFAEFVKFSPFKLRNSGCRIEKKFFFLFSSVNYLGIGSLGVFHIFFIFFQRKKNVNFSRFTLWFYLYLQKFKFSFYYDSIVLVLKLTSKNFKNFNFARNKAMKKFKFFHKKNHAKPGKSG